VGLPDGSACTTWSCDPGYVPIGDDPLCVDGGWSGSFGCYEASSVPAGDPPAHVLLRLLLGGLAVGALVREQRRARWHRA